MKESAGQKMDALFEQHITQNLAIMTFAIGQAAIEVRRETKDARGLKIFEAMLISPLVFHRRTAESFSKRTRTEGLFYRVLSDNRELVIGVQSRLVDMSTRTLQAIHLGCSANLFKMTHGAEIELVASSRSLPKVAENPSNTEAVTTILAASKRLGYCFATTEFHVLCAALRVRF